MLLKLSPSSINSVVGHILLGLQIQSYHTPVWKHRSLLQYAVCSSVTAGVTADSCIFIYIYLYLLTVIYIYKKYIGPGQFMSLPWAPSAGVKEFSQVTTVFWFFPIFFASSTYVFSINIFLCLLQWILTYLFIFFLWFSHANAGSCKPLRLPELPSVFQNFIALIPVFQFLQSHLVSSWAISEFLVCWFTEFSVFHMTEVDSDFFSASTRQKSHDFQVKFSIIYWIYCITWSGTSPLYTWIKICS